MNAVSRAPTAVSFLPPAEHRDAPLCVNIGTSGYARCTPVSTRSHCCYSSTDCGARRRATLRQRNIHMTIYVKPPEPLYLGAVPTVYLPSTVHGSFKALDDVPGLKKAVETRTARQLGTYQVYHRGVKTYGAGRLTRNWNAESGRISHLRNGGCALH